MSKWKHFLSISIDSRPIFTDHISSCCVKAARQVNALSRISENFDLKCRKLIFQSFVLSNFTYCPIVWHFCGKQNNGEIEKVQERALRILYDDYESECNELLDKSGAISMLQFRMNCIILEVFKSIHNSSPWYIQDMFEIKKSSYSMRDSSKILYYNRNETQQHLALDQLRIPEVSCGMTFPSILKKGQILPYSEIDYGIGMDPTLMMWWGISLCSFISHILFIMYIYVLFRNIYSTSYQYTCYFILGECVRACMWIGLQVQSPTWYVHSSPRRSACLRVCNSFTVIANILHLVAE